MTQQTNPNHLASYGDGYYFGFLAEAHGGKMCPESVSEEYTTGYEDGAHDYWLWRSEAGYGDTDSLSKKLIELTKALTNA